MSASETPTPPFVVLPSRVPGYWEWFFRGRSGDAGWKKFKDRWLFAHLAVGVAAALVLPGYSSGRLSDVAKTVLIPLASIFVGMTFAWIGNIQALLQSQEAEQLFQAHRGGAENYAFAFQSAALVMLITVCAWGIAGLGIFDLPCLWDCSAYPYEVVKVFLFFSVSLAIRECWHVVLGAQLLLLSQRFIRHLNEAQRAKKVQEHEELTSKKRASRKAGR